LKTRKNTSGGEFGRLRASLSARRPRRCAEPPKLDTYKDVRYGQATRDPKIAARACPAKDEFGSTSAGVAGAWFPTRHI